MISENPGEALPNAVQKPTVLGEAQFRSFVRRVMRDSSSAGAPYDPALERRLRHQQVLARWERQWPQHRDTGGAHKSVEWWITVYDWALMDDAERVPWWAGVRISSERDVRSVYYID